LAREDWMRRSEDMVLSDRAAADQQLSV